VVLAASVHAVTNEILAESRGQKSASQWIMPIDAVVSVALVYSNHAITSEIVTSECKSVTGTGVLLQ
jgi:hypothetical protein